MYSQLGLSPGVIVNCVCAWKVYVISLKVAAPLHGVVCVCRSLTRSRERPRMLKREEFHVAYQPLSRLTCHLTASLSHAQKYCECKRSL